MLAGLSGVPLAAGQPAQRDQASRVLDLLLDGLRYRAPLRAARTMVAPDLDTSRWRGDASQGP